MPPSEQKLPFEPNGTTLSWSGGLDSGDLHYVTITLPPEEASEATEVTTRGDRQRKFLPGTVIQFGRLSFTAELPPFVAHPVVGVISTFVVDVEAIPGMSFEFEGYFSKWATDPFVTGQRATVSGEIFILERTA